jgi:hypothetical protein
VEAPTPAIHPVRDIGGALLILGVVLLVVILFTVQFCEAGLVGPCLSNPYEGLRGGALVLSVVVVVAGLVLIVVGGRSGSISPPGAASPAAEAPVAHPPPSPPAA